MATVFRRPDLARDMAERLTRPSVLDEGLRSGLFLSGMRRTGKTTFVLNDLVPALEMTGAVVIYVDLWSDTRADPATLVLTAIRRCLHEASSAGSRLLKRLAGMQGLELDVAGLSFGFKLDRVGEEGGPTLAEAMIALVDQARTDVVLIVDEVQQALASAGGERLMLALKAARDAVNHRPDTPGHFLFIGTGSHRALVNELSTRRHQAFAGATSIPFPLLDDVYVRHVLERLADSGETRLPSDAVAVQAFETLGHRPEEFLKALRLLQRQLPEDADPDEHFPVIAATLRANAANVELARVAERGTLAEAIFDRIAMSDEATGGLFSARVVADFGRRIGREVRVEEIQPIVNDLLADNLIMRRGHGLYSVTDPFVQEAWREHVALIGQI
ncbi:MAG: ATPase [Gammaproteobacteria bacterium]|nr:MAG: ATPase [Gammaproteobacteria bacterium]